MGNGRRTEGLGAPQGEVKAMKGKAYTYARKQTSSFLEFVRSLGAVMGAADRERATNAEIGAKNNEAAEIAAERACGDGKRNS